MPSGEDGVAVGGVSRGGPCFILLCVFSPFSDAALYSFELLSSPGISPERRGTGLLLGPGSLAPGGVQGEGEGRTNRKREVEDLTLAGQCLAEIHALGDQGGVSFNHCSHFGLTS